MSKRTHEAMANGNGNGHAEAEMTTISEYLLTRLEQVGVSHAFGVPGDFFLRFLDYVEDHPTIEWVGCTNELNASYAADGYARMKRGLGVLVTTFGVGELSATNGIAGSFSEHVPVLHIVGVPSTGLQSKGALLHHTLGDGRFDAFQNIYSNITVTQAHIQPASRKFGTSTAGEEIDRAIFQALKTNRPTYLTLPTDLVDALIPAEPLRTSVTHSSIDRLLSEPGVSAEVEQHIIAKICKMYERAQRPCVLVDAGVVRFHMQDATKELIEKTGMTFFSSPMGKAAMDENSAQFGGNYVGSITMPGVKEAFENADFVLSLGSLKTDFNSAGFTYRMDTANTVELHNDHTMIQYATYPNAGYRSLLPKLIPAMAAIKKSPDQVVPRMERGGLIQHSAASGATPDGSHMIRQDEFWPLWASHFKNGDVVISEIGSASFGLLDVAFPTGAEMQAQILWGSIGWATAATLGAGLVARQQGRRTILFTGDGSIQLTVQEISTMIRQGLKPIIVVLNNDGYTVERIIHGAEKKYNDIQPWNWQQVLGLFSPQEQAGSHASHKTTTRRELEDLLNGPLLQDDSKIHLVEVILGRLDAPRALSAQAKMVTKANKPEEKAH